MFNAQELELAIERQKWMLAYSYFYHLSIRNEGIHSFGESSKFVLSHSLSIKLRTIRVQRNLRTRTPPFKFTRKLRAAL